jgi:hypothetical protein
VDSQSAMLVSQSEHRSGLMLSATNNGRIPAIIRQWGFYNPREVYVAMPMDGFWSSGPSMPHTLEPGTSQVWWLDYRQQKDRLKSQHPDSTHLLRGFVVLGTRKRKASRSFIDMSTGITIPVNSVRRRFDRIRSRRGIGLLIFGKRGARNFTLQLQSVGTRFLFTKIKIDVVQDQLGAQPARLLADSAIVRHFFGRRRIRIGIPIYLTDFPGAWYRIRWYSGKRPNEVRYGIPSHEALEQLRSSTNSPTSR